MVKLIYLPFFTHLFLIKIFHLPILIVCESYVLKKDEIVKLKVYRDAWWFHKTEEKLTAKK